MQIPVLGLYRDEAFCGEAQMVASQRYVAPGEGGRLRSQRCPALPHFYDSVQLPARAARTSCAAHSQDAHCRGCAGAAPPHFTTLPCTHQLPVNQPEAVPPRAGLWTYKKLSGFGHFIPREAAEELNPVLVDFLAGTGAKAAAQDTAADAGVVTAEP